MIIQPRAEGDVVKIALRLPVSLRDRVKQSANIQGRSMNTEIVAALMKWCSTENEKADATAS